MKERKPAIDPNSIIFNPKANAKEAAAVARQSRKINRRPLSEREALAAEAIAAAEEAAASRTSSDDDTEQVIGKLADGTSAKPPRVEAPSSRALAGEESIIGRTEDMSTGQVVDWTAKPVVHIVPNEMSPLLNLNETYKDFGEPVDVSGEEDAGSADGDDVPEEDEEYYRELAEQMEDTTLDEDGIETLPESNLAGRVLTYGDAAGGHDTWLAPSGGYQSFVMGDRIKVRNPLTGEPVLMALVSVDWDGEELECHVVYRPVASSE